MSLGLGAGFGFGSGCYAEREPPPTYRYQCGGNGDCEEGESCREGICERTCTQATFEDDCDSTHVMCFNGACSNTCEVGAGVCPSVQECVDLSELGVDIGGGSSNPFGGSTSGPLGICGRKCSESDDLCPDGETCLPDLTFPGPDGEDLMVGGFCVAMCDPTSTDAEQCGSGFTCLSLGLCVPESFDDSSSLDGVIPPDTGGIDTGGDMSGDDSSSDIGGSDTVTTGDDTTGGDMTGGTTG